MQIVKDKDALLKDLVDAMRAARFRHRTLMRKVRRDRVHKFLPDLTEEQAALVITYGIECGVLEERTKLDDATKQQIPAIKLVNLGRGYQT